MSMSRNDFDKIAAALANRMVKGTSAERFATMMIAIDLADIFAEANPRFNYRRFYVAVGLSEDGTLLDVMARGSRA